MFSLLKVLINNASFNLIARGPREPEPNGVVKRIYDLLDATGLTHSQLLNYVPSDWNWTLATISEPRQFLEAINPEVLAWFANTFEINREWLEEASDQIHESLGGYKDLPKLYESLRTMGWIGPSLRMSILAEDYERKYRFLNRYAIVFSLPMFDTDDASRTFYKHKLFETEWTYSHWPCKSDTKTVARWFSMELNHFGMIPIIPISRNDFKQIANGNVLIAKHWSQQFGGFDRFEDRVLSANPDGESVCALETEDLPLILENLDKLKANGFFVREHEKT